MGRARFDMSLELLHAVLHLPDDVTVVYVQPADTDTYPGRSCEITVESDLFPPGDTVLAVEPTITRHLLMDRQRFDLLAYTWDFHLPAPPAPEAGDAP